MLTFETLRSQNAPRCQRWHPATSIPWSLADWSNALCGEAGELANFIKKLRRHETGAVNEGDPKPDALVAAAGEELADVVIYADLLAHKLGLDLATEIVTKFNTTSMKHGFPERLDAVDEGTTRRMDLLETAWVIIANAQGGDWEKATPEWKAAAERFREAYHAELKTVLPYRPELPIEECEA